MTDITELAQREKFEAWAEECNALPWGYLKKLRIYTGFYSEHTYTRLWAAWKAAGAELVEALELKEEQRANWFQMAQKLGEDLDAAEKRIAELESRTVTVKLPPKIECDDADGWFMYKGGRVGGGAAEWYNKALDDVSSALVSVVTVTPEDADGVREDGNQSVGHLEDYLLQILKADPLATIDIVTHRYCGAGGQYAKDSDEYLHEMGIKWEAE